MEAARHGERRARDEDEHGTNEEWAFQYDALGNLLSVALPNGDLVEYLVDGLGRRISKKKTTASNVVVLHKQWIYRDALKPVAELDGSGALVAEFVYGSKGNVPDYVRRGGNTYRVISDHLGSPRYVVNVTNSADVPFRAEYSSFGEVTGTGLDWMPFGFAGGIYDPDSGLVRFGVRDLDPLVGRWTAKDPIRWRGGDSDLYVYVANDPINRIDPSGLTVWSDEETLAILLEAIASYNGQELIPGLCSAYANSSGPPLPDGKYDFKHHPDYGSDTFSVAGLGQLDSAQFGNYFAGFVHAATFGPAGVFLTLLGGGMLHPGEGFDDAASVELIERGAYDWFSGWGGCWGMRCNIGSSCAPAQSICGGY